MGTGYGEPKKKIIERFLDVNNVLTLPLHAPTTIQTRTTTKEDRMMQSPGESNSVMEYF